MPRSRLTSFREPFSKSWAKNPCVRSWASSIGTPSVSPRGYASPVGCSRSAVLPSPCGLFVSSGSEQLKGLVASSLRQGRIGTPAIPSTSDISPSSLGSDCSAILRPRLQRSPWLLLGLPWLRSLRSPGSANVWGRPMRSTSATFRGFLAVLPRHEVRPNKGMHWTGLGCGVPEPW